MTALSKFAKAVAILAKADPDSEFRFEHDEGFFGGPSLSAVSKEDLAVLEAARFTWDADDDCWHLFC